MTSSDRFLVPVRSADKSNVTAWYCQNLSIRALKLTPECGPMSNVMTALSNIGGVLGTKPQSLADAPTQVSCNNAINIGERKTWTQSILHFHYGARDPENVYIAYQPRRRPKIVQSLLGFRWATSLQKRFQDAKCVEICWGAPNWPTDLSR